MNNLIKWELKHTFKSKAFWGFGLFYLAIALLLLVDIQGGELATGYDAFLTNCNNLRGFFTLTIGIFGGTYFADAFEERRIQAAIMAGNSRLNIVLSKILASTLAIMIFSVIELVTGSAISFMSIKETGVDSWKPVIATGTLFTLAWAALTSICFIISMLVKKTGAAIALNTVTMIGLDFIVELTVEQPWGERLSRFTLPGQTFFSLAAESKSEMITSALVSVSGLLLITAVSYIIFRKDELK